MEASAHGAVRAPRDPSRRPVDDPVRAIASAVGSLWWLWLAFGIFWIAVAFVVLQLDQASITTVGVLLGLMFLVAGLQQLFIALFASAGRDGCCSSSACCC